VVGARPLSFLAARPGTGLVQLGSTTYGANSVAPADPGAARSAGCVTWYRSSGTLEAGVVVLVPVLVRGTRVVLCHTPLPFLSCAPRTGRTGFDYRLTCVTAIRTNWYCTSSRHKCPDWPTPRARALARAWCAHKISALSGNSRKQRTCRLVSSRPRGSPNPVYVQRYPRAHR
jgi:hypothetical protein